MWQGDGLLEKAPPNCLAWCQSLCVKVPWAPWALSQSSVSSFSVFPVTALIAGVGGVLDPAPSCPMGGPASQELGG